MLKTENERGPEIEVQMEELMGKIFYIFVRNVECFECFVKMFHFRINFDREMKDKGMFLENVEVTTIKIKGRINILRTRRRKIK